MGHRRRPAKNPLLKPRATTLSEPCLANLPRFSTRRSAKSKLLFSNNVAGRGVQRQPCLPMASEPGPIAAYLEAKAPAQNARQAPTSAASVQIKSGAVAGGAAGGAAGELGGKPVASRLTRLSRKEKILFGYVVRGFRTRGLRLSRDEVRIVSCFGPDTHAVPGR